MNSKLIALLIRSNAALIEAMGEVTRQLDKSGNYSENHFWNLRSEVIAMAEAAEAMDNEIQTQVVSVSSDPRNMEKISELIGELKTIPIIPISPSYQIKVEPLIADIQSGRKFHGKFENNIETYLAVITGISVTDVDTIPSVIIKTSVIAIGDVPVAPYDRPLPYMSFQEEFLRWKVA